MKSLKLATAFAATLALAPVAHAQETAPVTTFNPETTGTLIVNSASLGFNYHGSQTYPNMQSCLEQIDAEIADFNDMERNDIIAPGDSITMICEDDHERVTVRFTHEFGVQRSITF